MDTAIEFFQGREDFDDPCAVAMYRVFVRGVEVSVAVHDYGEAAGDDRYSALARYADPPFGREIVMNTYGLSLGRTAATVDGALESVHWDVFPPITPDDRPSVAG